MSVSVLDHCPGCGKCSRPGVCPVSAITITGGKAVIGPGCINCGLCILACPIGLIRPVTEEPDEKPVRVVPEGLGEEGEHEQTSTGS